MDCTVTADHESVTAVHRHRSTAGGTSERGASSVEYGMLIAGIAAVLVTVIIALGLSVTRSIDDTCDTVSATAATSGCPGD